HRPPHSATMFLQDLELFRLLRIADLVCVEIYHTNTCSVFYFACSKIVQQRPPLFVLFEIFGDTLGKQNMPGIPAFHHTVRYVETASRQIRATGHIDHTTDRAAVHSHADL